MNPQQPSPIHPALHFDADRAAIGIVGHDGKPRLVLHTSQGPCALWEDLEQAYKNGQIFPAAYADRGLAERWPARERERFLSRPESASLREAAGGIRRVLGDHLELKRPQDVSLITLWILGTYFSPLFLTYPRLNLLGEKGSGKSKALQLIAVLGFNGLHMLEPTGAVLFRLIEPLRPTLCLDEMENLDRDARKAIGAIFNAGYKWGARVPRTEERDGRRVVEWYGVYAPLAVASIAGLTGVQEDRAITLVFAKGHDRAKINREVNPEEATFGEIRAQLYRLALTRYQDVRTTWKTMEIPPWLVARHRELYKPY